MPEFDLAGAERMAESLILELKHRGCEVIAVSLYDYHSVITENLENNGVKVYYMGKRRGPDPSMITKLARLLRREKPDLVHTHRYVCEYVIPAAILAGIKARVHTVHNVAEKERLPKKLQHFFYHCCHVVPVGLSPLVKTSIERFYRLPGDRVPMVYNGIDISKVTQKEGYQSDEGFRFLHVGRFAPQKNHANIVKAFAQLHSKYPDTTLTMIGSGELFEEVQELVHSLGLQEAVHLPGQMNNVIEQYPLYDAFILPSLYEGMPITLIEAMAAGMPIAASAVGGVPDMLCHEDSALLCSAQIDSITEVMERLYLDASLREKLGRKALLDSVRFTSTYMTDAYMDIYSKACRAKK
jgi:glycosyltransferase involved in cell wall biosynthesis